MGVGWKGKVSAVHAGPRIGWEKGGEERREKAGFGSGGERRGRAAAPWGLGVGSEIPAAFWAGSLAAV